MPQPPVFKLGGHSRYLMQRSLIKTITMAHVVEKEGLEIRAMLGTEKGEPLVLLNLIKAQVCLYFRSKAWLFG